MAFESILLDVAGKVATITLNRPDKLIPIDLFMGNEINAALDAIDADKKVQIIVFRGAEDGQTSSRGALGLGLSLVRRIARAHGVRRRNVRLDFTLGSS